MYLLIAAYSWSKNSYILFPQIFADMQMLSFSDTQKRSCSVGQKDIVHMFSFGLMITHTVS